MGLGETITVINKSGKVVSSSKHIVGVWKEARAVYRERKAEIQADRDAAARERRLAEGVSALRIEDDAQSHASSRRSRHSRPTHRSKSHRHSHGNDRPALQRGFTDTIYANDMPTHHSEQDLAGQNTHGQELMRRNTDMYHSAHGSKKRDSIDMDLAYGDVPPPLPLSKRREDGELREKASKITMLLDEANCLQHTVTTTIENLQKNPEALAAISLTLAEISAILGKMGPGALIALRSSFPAVAALLLSPQFMIAGGVAVGVTIVALGGYKIIKKIQAQKEDGPVPMPGRGGPAIEEPSNELDELEPQELGQVELWRRGIADIEAASVGTDVDGELITPDVSRQLVAAGVLDGDDLKSRRSTRSRKEGGEARPKARRAKSESSVKSSGTLKTRKSKTVKEDGHGSSKSKRKAKVKEPSGLRMLFRPASLAA